MKARGFTLVEILVVVAIIAILMAILFPVFAAARETARQTMCLSNIHQIALAIRMYAQDQDETLPFNQARIVPGDPESGYFWRQVVHPYINLGNARGYGVTTIDRCPSSRNQRSNAVNPAIMPDNWTVNVPPNSIESMYVSGVVSWAQIQNASEKIMVAADRGDVVTKPLPGNREDPEYGMFHALQEFWEPSILGDCDEKAWNTARICGTTLRYRHHGTTNVAYCDGHGKAMHKGQVKWYVNISMPWLEGRRSW